VDAVDRSLIEDLPALLRVLQNSDVSELEVQEGDVHIRLHRARRSVAAPEVDRPDVLPTIEPLVQKITAPLVGTFYRAEKPGAPPFVSEGSHVEDDTVVGIIEALQVLTEVEAGCSGLVRTVLSSDGQSVQYGQVLFEVVPDG
jgi:acetyl-CoA carboxylase biotin carboxyl carrier protein